VLRGLEPGGDTVFQTRSDQLAIETQGRLQDRVCVIAGPVHTMKKGEVTKLEDLVLLCANCHRIVHVKSPWLPPLLKSIATTKTGDLTFLVTAKGRPFDKWTFGNWFRAACVKAQVPGSAHGIRKASASAVAEGGATEAEMNSPFGWAHGRRESATYIEKASRKRMAKKASKLLFSRTSELGKGEINIKNLKPKDKV
jgi:hypothetical protein